MKCLKCGGENFILESSVLLIEKYKIFKNGKISNRPFEKIIDRVDMAENDNVLRCEKCDYTYAVFYKGRSELLSKTDYSMIDLSRDTEVIE